MFNIEMAFVYMQDVLEIGLDSGRHADEVAQNSSIESAGARFRVGGLLSS